MNQKPLVSVVVVTYNSSKTIIETLESIYDQVYDNLELIITDDGSKDNTVEICQIWLERYGSRFKRSNLLRLTYNLGVVQNFLNGINACNGEWIKGIAGDDLLTSDCIDVFEAFISKTPKCSIVFGNTQAFKTENGKRIFLENCLKRDMVAFSQLTAEEQCNELYKGNGLPASCYFIKKDLLKKYNMITKYRNLEDWPYWIFLTKNGVHIDYVNQVLALYRRDGSVTLNKNTFWNLNYASSIRLFYADLISELRASDSTLAEKYEKELLEMYFCIYFLNNKRTLLNKIIWKLICNRLYRGGFLKF